MGKRKVTNVLLADGRKLLREGLSALLEKHEDVRVIGEAADAATAVKLLRALPAHVVILNLTAPFDGVANAVRTLVKVKPKVRVIVHAYRPTAAVIRELLEAGAAGCLTKESAAAELVDAIRVVVAGRDYLSPGLVNAVITGYVRTVGPAVEERPLSPREREILQRIAAGQTTKEIAFAFGVSAKTVETCRRRIMQKTDRHSVAELTKYAILHGMATLETTA